VLFRSIRISLEDAEVGSADNLPLEQGKYVKISISDNGEGILSENMEQIFKGGFTTKKGGSGIGLSASMYTVRNHGGYIDVKSESGVGTAFYIYLPSQCCD